MRHTDAADGWNAWLEFQSPKANGHKIYRKNIVTSQISTWLSTLLPSRTALQLHPDMTDKIRCAQCSQGRTWHEVDGFGRTHQLPEMGSHFSENSIEIGHIFIPKDTKMG